MKNESSFWIIHLFIYKEIGKGIWDQFRGFEIKKSNGVPAQVVGAGETHISGV
jgi:hypothetical protein